MLTPKEAELEADLRRAIELHEDFKREVSDAVERVRACWGESAWPSGYACKYLDHFRLERKPPNPVLLTLNATLARGWEEYDEDDVDEFLEALEAHGLVVTRKGN